MRCASRRCPPWRASSQRPRKVTASAAAQLAPRHRPATRAPRGRGRSGRRRSAHAPTRVLREPHVEDRAVGIGPVEERPGGSGHGGEDIDADQPPGRCDRHQREQAEPRACHQHRGGTPGAERARGSGHRGQRQGERDLAADVIREWPSQLRIEQVGEAGDHGGRDPPAAAGRPQPGAQRQHRQHQREDHEEERGVGQVADRLHQTDAEGRQGQAAQGGPGNRSAASPAAAAGRCPENSSRSRGFHARTPAG